MRVGVEVKNNTRVGRDITIEQLHLLAFSVVGQCLFYHFADPVVRNLLDAKEYDSLDIEKLAEHVVEFSIAALGHAAESPGAKS